MYIGHLATGPCLEQPLLSLLSLFSLSSTKDAVGPSEAAGGSSTVSGRENGLHLSRQSTSHTEKGEGKGEERRGGEKGELWGIHGERKKVSNGCILWFIVLQFCEWDRCVLHDEQLDCWLLLQVDI